ncbi:MAG: UPF0149 family protein [Pseudomonadota bacterium]
MTSDPPAQRLNPSTVFDQIEAKLRASPILYGASALHGLVCGLICAGMPSEQIRNRSALLNTTDPVALTIAESLISLAERDLNDAQMRFSILLPSDESSLEERFSAITEWCAGFVDAIGYEMDSRISALSAAGNEALEDIQSISTLDPYDPNNVPQEEQLLQFSEYLRVATMTIFEDLNPVRPADSQQVH